MAKKKAKIAAFCVALALICLLIFVVGLGIGNPIGYLIAWGRAEILLQTEYEDKDYQIAGMGYEAKHGQYVVEVKSPTKVDEYFQLWMNGFGKIRTNNYKYRVEGKVNTVARLTKEYETYIAERGLWESFSDSYSCLSYVFCGWSGQSYVPHEEALTKEELELNKAYDIQDFARVHGELSLSAKIEEATFEKVAELVLQIKSLADEKNVPFYTVSVYLDEIESDSDEPIAGVAHFRYQDIYETNLVERIKANFENYQRLKAEAGLGEPI